MYILCVCFEKERLVKDYYIDGRNFANFHWGRAFNPNNPTQTHSIYVKLEKKILFRYAKGKGIVNALGQNLANSESCPILSLL
jgi:hypothetical protein